MQIARPRTVVESEAVQSPENLAEQERLARFSESLLAVHHELNNPLCAVLLNTQLLALALPADSKLTERVRAIEDNARKIQAIVKRLTEEKSAELSDPTRPATATPPRRNP